MGGAAVADAPSGAGAARWRPCEFEDQTDRIVEERVVLVGVAVEPSPLGRSSRGDSRNSWTYSALLRLPEGDDGGGLLFGHQSA